MLGPCLSAGAIQVDSIQVDSILGTYLIMAVDNVGVRHCGGLVLYRPSAHLDSLKPAFTPNRLSWNSALLNKVIS